MGLNSAASGTCKEYRSCCALRGATFWGRVVPRSVELYSMVSVGPSALSCPGPLRNYWSPAPQSYLYDFQGDLQMGFNSHI